MINAMMAGKMEKSAHIILFTASGSVMVTVVWPVTESVPEAKPAMPNSRATRNR